MSIIYDALKKVEKSHPIGLANKIDKDDKPKSKTRIYLLYILVVCSLFFIANIFFTSSQKPLKNSSAVNIPKEPSKELPSPQINPPPEAKPQPMLVLNGIFFSEDKGYALINNQILKEGDIIEGAKVERINLEGVDLEFEGQSIKLSTNK